MTNVHPPILQEHQELARLELGAELRGWRKPLLPVWRLDLVAVGRACHQDHQLPAAEAEPARIELGPDMLEVLAFGNEEKEQAERFSPAFRGQNLGETYSAVRLWGAEVQHVPLTCENQRRRRSSPNASLAQRGAPHSCTVASREFRDAGT